jgi:hypothetical protein
MAEIVYDERALGLSIEATTRLLHLYIFGSWLAGLPRLIYRGNGS